MLASCARPDEAVASLVSCTVLTNGTVPFALFVGLLYSVSSCAWLFLPVYDVPRVMAAHGHDAEIDYVFVSFSLPPILWH